MYSNRVEPARPLKVLAPDRVEPTAEAKAAARVVARAILGRTIRDRDRQAIDRLPHWPNLLVYVEGEEDRGLREERARRHLNGMLGRDITSAEAAAMLRALDAALVETEPAEAPEPRQALPFDLGLVRTAEFFAQEHRLEWLAKGILTRGENGILGGPQKSLKTSVLIDLALSLASGTPFLGRFHVPKPVRVMLISGESGRGIIQANAKQVCHERRLSWDAVNEVHWGFNLPQLTDPNHLDAMRQAIEANAIDAVLVDPVYLTLGGAEIDQKNMFEMGPHLKRIADACIESGATPVLAHHFIKHRENPYGPPELEDLAYAGFGQFMRQWILLSRREPFDPETGVHRMHFRYGGSAGHAGELHLDIETGRIAEDLHSGRKWVVNVASPSEGIAARKEQQQTERQQQQTEKARQKVSAKETEERESMARLLKALHKEPDHKATAKRLRDATGWRKDKVDRILYRLDQDGFIRPAEVETDMGRGGPKTFRGFELINPEEIRP